jgi:hypothetical protein
MTDFVIWYKLFNDNLVIHSSSPMTGFSLALTIDSGSCHWPWLLESVVNQPWQ